MCCLSVLGEHSRAAGRRLDVFEACLFRQGGGKGTLSAESLLAELAFPPFSFEVGFSLDTEK
eukprot:6704176-Alexandrium_andersonii.AAC.1